MNITYNQPTLLQYTKCESLSILVTAFKKNRKWHTINQVTWYVVKKVELGENTDISTVFSRQ